MNKGKIDKYLFLYTNILRPLALEGVCVSACAGLWMQLPPSGAYRDQRTNHIVFLSCFLLFYY